MRIVLPDNNVISFLEIGRRALYHIRHLDARLRSEPKWLGDGQSDCGSTETAELAALRHLRRLSRHSDSLVAQADVVGRRMESMALQAAQSWSRSEALRKRIEQAIRRAETVRQRAIIVAGTR